MGQAVSETTLNPNQGITEAVFGLHALKFATLTKWQLYERVLTIPDRELKLLNPEIEAAFRETQKVKLAAQAGQWPTWGHFTIAKRKRLAWIKTYLEGCGRAPPEAELEGDDTPEARLERFCRVRHQVCIRCINCWTDSRLVVRWSEDEGFIYPILACPEEGCGGHRVTQIDETYIERTPRPDAFDPEPRRTRQWWTRIGKLDFSPEESLPS